jgi:hypothetical protein
VLVRELLEGVDGLLCAGHGALIYVYIYIERERNSKA